MTFKHTFTHYLLLPMLEIDYIHHSACGIDEAYLGCPEMTGDSDLHSDFMYVTYKTWNTAPDESKKVLRSHADSVFTNETNGLLTVTYPIPEKYKIDVEYFIRGEYSKIDKGYVKEHFPEKIHIKGEEHFNPNRGVFDKADFIRDQWEELFNVQIPEGQEVWPKPDPDREILKPAKQNSNATDPPLLSF